MFLGPLLPLPHHLSLTHLLRPAEAHEVLGAWVAQGPRKQWVYRLYSGGRRVLASPDLRFLLAHCGRVVVREGQEPVVLAAETIIQWRALQVATAMPFLPGVERLRALFPGLQVRGLGVVVPLRARSPEEVLAGCVAEGMHVTGSRIVYAREVDAALSTGLRS